jgi:hypothetical protein
MGKSTQKEVEQIQDAVWSILEHYSQSLNSEERSELKTIIALIAHARGTLTLNQISAVVERRWPHSGSVEEKLRRKYGALFLLDREDGITEEAFELIKLHMATINAKPQQSFFPSNPETTTVSFANKSITCYFELTYCRALPRGEFRTKNTEGHFLLLLECLESIVEAGHGTSPSPSKLVEYAICHWYRHLREATRALKYVSSHEHLRILSLLVAIFQDHSVLRIWLNTNLWRVFNSDLVKLILRWARKKSAAYREELSECERRTIAGWLSSPRLIFSHVLQVASEEWLDNTSWNVEYVADTVFQIYDYCEIPQPSILTILPPDLVVTAAAYARPNRTATWHRRVGQYMMAVRYFGPAKASFQAALAMDSDMRAVHADMAMLYEKRDADEDMFEAMDEEYAIYMSMVPPLHLAGDNQAVLKEWSHAYEELYRRERLKENPHAWKHLRDAAKTGYISISKMRVLLASLWRKEAFAEMLSVMKCLESTPDDSGWGNQLIHALASDPVLTGRRALSIGYRLFECVAKAASSQEEVKWLEGVYNDAASLAEERRDHLTGWLLAESRHGLSHWRQHTPDSDWSEEERDEILSKAQEKWDMETLEFALRHGYTNKSLLDNLHCSQHALNGGVAAMCTWRVLRSDSTSKTATVFTDVLRRFIENSNAGKLASGGHIQHMCDEMDTSVLRLGLCYRHIGKIKESMEITRHWVRQCSQHILERHRLGDWLASKAHIGMWCLVTALQFENHIDDAITCARLNRQLDVAVCSTCEKYIKPTQSMSSCRLTPSLRCEECLKTYSFHPDPGSQKPPEVYHVPADTAEERAEMNRLMAERKDPKTLFVYHGGTIITLESFLDMLVKKWGSM